MKYRSRARAQAQFSSRRPAPPLTGRSKTRTARGNSLILMTVCTIGLLVALAFFGLGYVRLLSSNNEQRTAIEAAALVAARDLGKIAIKCQAEGDSAKTYWISLSDCAPTGRVAEGAGQTSTMAHGINTILATIRLDLLIADQVGDAKLKSLIIRDLAFAQAAQAELNSALQDAIKASPSRQYTDAAGNAVIVYQDALKAYTSNQMRMTGTSSYVDASLSLSLGCEPGVVTNVPIPSCAAAVAQIPQSATANDLYLAYVDVPFKDTAGGISHFVFAGIGNNARLCNPKTWAPVVTALPSDVPYLPCIVRAEADQHMNSSESVSGYTVHAVACAQPASTVDPLMTGESTALSFPVPSHTSTGAIPASELDSDKHSPLRQNIYDWLKGSGCKLNVASAVALITQYTGPNRPAAAPPAESPVPAPVPDAVSAPAPAAKTTATPAQSTTPAPASSTKPAAAAGNPSAH